MIKLDTPYWARMQNFLFMPDGSIFWTTASRSPGEMIADIFRKLTGKKKPLRGAMTSLGKRIHGHGQWILLEGNNIVFDDGKDKIVYDNKLNMLSKSPSTRFTGSELVKMAGAPKGIPLQGVDYYDGLATCYGAAGRSKIKVLVYDDKMKMVEHYWLSFSKYKWYIKEWEAEGIRFHPSGNNMELWLGINYKTTFSTHLNYITCVASWRE